MAVANAVSRHTIERFSLRRERARARHSRDAAPRSPTRERKRHAPLHCTCPVGLRVPSRQGRAVEPRASLLQHEARDHVLEIRRLISLRATERETGDAVERRRREEHGRRGGALPLVRDRTKASTAFCVTSSVHAFTLCASYTCGERTRPRMCVGASAAARRAPSAASTHLRVERALAHIAKLLLGDGLDLVELEHRRAGRRRRDLHGRRAARPDEWGRRLSTLRLDARDSA